MAAQPANTPIRDFTSWYVESHDRLYTVLRLVTGDDEVASEAVDEAFTRALEKWARVSAMENPNGWTYKVALNYARRSTRRRGWPSSAPSTASSTDDYADLDLWRAVARLPHRQRTAMTLRYVADLRERDIAGAMGVRPGTVARLLHDARKSLALDDTWR